MAWETPKTDWVSTDTFNVGDFNRIKNNLNYLAEECGEVICGSAIVIIDMGVDKVLPSVFYATEMNKFENNLVTISENSFRVDYGTKTIYTADGNTPTYVEMNRIESATLDLYTMASDNKSAFRFYLSESYCGESALI